MASVLAHLHLGLHYAAATGVHILACLVKQAYMQTQFAPFTY